MIKISASGNFKSFESFADKVLNGDIYSKLDVYGRAGVNALASATPVDSSLTASSWGYEIVRKGDVVGIYWTNSSVTEDGTPIVILLQYGHGTGTGGYVQGQDFINPAIRDVFDKIADNVWKEVTSA